MKVEDLPCGTHYKKLSAPGNDITYIVKLIKKSDFIVTYVYDGYLRSEPVKGFMTWDMEDSTEEEFKRVVLEIL